jgi:integrase/recombinase XerD
MLEVIVSDHTTTVFHHYHPHFGTQGRQRTYDKIIGALKVHELPGEELAIDHIRQKYRKNCKLPTIRTTADALRDFLRFLKDSGFQSLTELTRSDVTAFVEHEQDRGLHPVSVKTKLGHIYNFIWHLTEQGIVDSDLTKRKIRIRTPDALPRAIDPTDIRRLLSAIDSIRNRAMVLLLLRTGLRIGELLCITMGDLAIRERKIMIYEGEKNRLGRVVYFGDDAHDALLAWIAARDPGKAFLFYAQGRQILTYSGAHAMFAKYLRRAHLEHKGYSLHCLRHTCATDLLNAGMRLECLQQLLGHNCIEMTRRYARLTDKTREEEYFRAMTIIEKGQTDGYDQYGDKLPAIYETAELLDAYR